MIELYMLESLLTEAVRPRVNYKNVKKLFGKYIEVESSNIHSFLYDKNSQTMRVRFLSGAEYEYYRVPIRIFMGLLNSQSHGQGFWKLARNVFSYSRLPNWADPEEIEGNDFEDSFEPLEIDDDDISF
jgi:hypothetical protein